MRNWCNRTARPCPGRVSRRKRRPSPLSQCILFTAIFLRPLFSLRIIFYSSCDGRLHHDHDVPGAPGSTRSSALRSSAQPHDPGARILAKDVGCVFARAQLPAHHHHLTSLSRARPFRHDLQSHKGCNHASLDPQRARLHRLCSRHPLACGN